MEFTSCGEMFQPSQAGSRHDGLFGACVHVSVRVGVRTCVRTCVPAQASVRAGVGVRACVGGLVCLSRLACLFKSVRLWCERCWRWSLGLHGYRSCSRNMPQQRSM